VCSSIIVLCPLLIFVLKHKLLFYTIELIKFQVSYVDLEKFAVVVLTCRRTIKIDKLQGYCYDLGKLYCNGIFVI